MSYKILFRTRDSAVTWDAVAEALIPGPLPANSLPGAGSATDLFFLDEVHGWMSTSRFGAFATDDGGHTWRHLASVSVADDFLSTISFATSKVGYVVSYPTYTGRNYAEIPALFRTNDGGNTWTEICVGELMTCGSTPP